MIPTGAQFGRYSIMSPLGTGGMGEVYRAHDPALRRDVALKILRPDRLSGEAGRDPSDWIARMLREARSAAALRHPNVVAVHDVGEVNGAPFIVMELVDGRPLRAYVRDPTVPVADKIRWLRDLADALAAAHRAGLLHRDVKPDNVMIAIGGHVKVLDFGIAKQQSAPDAQSRATMGAGPASFQTAEGRVLGTPRYMAPEQASGGPLDGRADQFAWGCVAYELLSGGAPAQGGSRRSLNELNAGVAPEIAAIVERALAWDREQRFPTMDSIVAAIAPFVATATSDPVQTATTQVGSVFAAPQPAFSPPTQTTAHGSVREVVPPPAKAGLSPIVALVAIGGGIGLVAVVAVAAIFGYRAYAEAHAPPVASSVPAAPASTTAQVVTAPSAVASARTGPRGSAIAPKPSAVVPVAPIAPTPISPPAPSAPEQTGCLCLGADGRNWSSLCKELIPPKACKCIDSVGRSVCPVAMTGRPSCPDDYFRTPPLRKGASCSGFLEDTTSSGTAANTRATGALQCDGCEQPRTYAGQEGGSCRGFDHWTWESRPGRLSCSGR